jgi:hypothetical protein
MMFTGIAIHLRGESARPESVPMVTVRFARTVQAWSQCTPDVCSPCTATGLCTAHGGAHRTPGGRHAWVRADHAQVCAQVCAGWLDVRYRAGARARCMPTSEMRLANPCSG